MISSIDQSSSVVSIRSFAPSSRDIWWCLGPTWGEGAAGIRWVEDQDTAEHITTHRTAPDTKAQNVSSADIEKPYSSLWLIQW